MDDHKKSDNEFGSIISKLVNTIAILSVIIIALTVALIHYVPAPNTETKSEAPLPDQYGNFTDAAKLLALEKLKDTVDYWQAPDTKSIDDAVKKDLILYGKDLIIHTSDYFGLNGTILSSSTNGMNCQNCHLEAGTKIFGNNYSAVASTYPKYRARSGSVENIYKRVNDCFERSLNGKALDTSSKEMRAIIAYINWLGKDVPKGQKPGGSGLKDITFLDRAANAEKGKTVYIQKCQSCHQSNGEGVLNASRTAYTYPPLWGNFSFNDGAGLYRISNFAKYIKYNMPSGTTFNAAQLTDEEAWDISAFVNSQQRPHLQIKNDWPKIAEKPFDHPFGPYADGFSETQHKLGPYQPIIAKLAILKKTHR